MSEQTPTPPEGGRPYTVVVGVSATSKSAAALEWGAAQAAANHGRLVAVRSWRVTGPPGSMSGGASARVTDERDTARSEMAALEADVAAVLGPEHSVEVRSVRGGKRKALLAAAEEADLLVIDAPRSLTGPPLFAQRLVYAASCPVVVMPPRVSQLSNPLEQAGRVVGRAAVRSAGLAGRPGYRPPMAH
ncbi:universal stress protein [Knoellia sp. LjRoot47]|uniref:universal stress protein n=1 Tax=Knoellia sp. LjRoot47 TaxID=3342330 RepID=UPI003ECEDD83